MFTTILVLAITAGVAFRLTNLGKKEYWNDEVWTSIWISGYSASEMEAELAHAGVISSGDLLKYQRLQHGRGVLRSLAILAHDDPKQSALHLFLVRIWAGLFGDSPARIRSLSAMMGILGFAALYWFCRELFPRTRVGWTALLLFALSPFHVAYAQEARPYTLWVVTTLVSSAALLLALRSAGAGVWMVYASSAAAGLYSHTLFGFVILSHLLLVWSQHSDRREHLMNHFPLGFKLSLAGALALYLPWLLFMLDGLGRLKENTGWVARIVGYQEFANRLALGLSSSFVDLGLPPRQAFAHHHGAIVTLFVVVPVLGLIAWAARDMWRHAERRASVFLFSLALPPILFLVVPDLALGGGGFATPRFLAPLLLAALVSVAFSLGRRLIAQAPTGTRRGAMLTLTLLAAAGAMSDVRFVTASTWWVKAIPLDLSDVAEHLNESERPLVVGERRGLDLRRLISLSHFMGPDLHLFMIGSPEPVEIPAGYSDVFWLGISKTARHALESEAGVRLEPVASVAGFWRVLESEAGRQARDSSSGRDSSPGGGRASLGRDEGKARLPRHHIRPSELPRPYATQSALNPPRVVPRPNSAALTVPPGFEVIEAASGFNMPRQMALAPNGDIFLSESAAGRITVLRDSNADGRFEGRWAYSDDFNLPFGIAFAENHVYVANTGSVVRFAYKPGDIRSSGEPELVARLPGHGYSQHWTRNLLYNPESKLMFVSVGSQGNIGEEEPRRAAILAFTIPAAIPKEGVTPEIYASGLRNPVGLAFEPANGALWTAVNERDGLGDDLVPDYATSVVKGGFYGWPYAYIGPNPQPGFAERRPDLVQKTLVPDVLFEAHSAALGICFYTHSTFPEHFRSGAFVAHHGSWNRSRRVGYKVVYLPFKDGRPLGYYEDFLTGFGLDPDKPEVWGRPVGVLVDRDGSLLVTDDGGDKVWRVVYKRK